MNCSAHAKQKKIYWLSYFATFLELKDRVNQSKLVATGIFLEKSARFR
jgi:hypothetical protein